MDWRRIPSLSALRAFEATARLQSFTKAGAELNVTQAAIAQHVRGLEADLGEALVTRQGRGIAVTATGAELANCLNTGFAAIADGVENIRARTEARPLTVTTTPTFAELWLMPRMGGFWAAHPEVQISILPSNAVNDLRRDNLDMAIRYGAGDWPNVEAKMLTEGNFLVVAHPKLLAGRSASCVADVADLDWFFEPSMLERRVLVAQDGLELSAAQTKTLSTNALVLAAAKSGLGVSVQPSSIVAGAVARGELQAICELRQENYGYYTVTVPGRVPKGLRVFLKWLHTQAKEGEAAHKGPPKIT